MMIKKRVINAVSCFLRNESGAITVDWVVLTAAVVGLVIGLFVFLTPTVYSNAGEAIASQVNRAAER